LVAQAADLKLSILTADRQLTAYEVGTILV